MEPPQVWPLGAVAAIFQNGHCRLYNVTILKAFRTPCNILCVTVKPFGFQEFQAKICDLKKSKKYRRLLSIDLRVVK